ncbi:MAG: N-acetylmuramoyl-L-alanine amidase family protein [Agathobaculum sp.]|jgi:N-acetylmuramoyl-L-alanine amidase CwlA|uniref:peptidoglycan recognition protein family protein n=1 Tax=Agathobaculum sp. TaxID=2048138 RepID=UPI003D906B60
MAIQFKQCNAANYQRGRSASVQWIVLHFTANDGDTAKNNADYFARAAGLQASAHYFVDEREVWQSVRDGDTAWHCGTSAGQYRNACRNANSIGVEMCSRIVGGRYVIAQDTVRRAAALVRQLMERYHVPLSRVCRHYDVTGKRCPEPWVRDDAQWIAFRKLLRQKEDEEVVEKKPVRIDGMAYTCSVIQKAGENYVRLRDLSQAGYGITYDANTKVPGVMAPQTRAAASEPDADTQAAVDTVRTLAGLEEQTAAYLLRYQYGDELVKKLAKAMTV